MANFKNNVVLIFILVWFELHNAYAVPDKQETQQNKYDIDNATKALARVNKKIRKDVDDDQLESFYTEPSVMKDSEAIDRLNLDIENKTKKFIKSTPGKSDDSDQDNTRAKTLEDIINKKSTPLQEIEERRTNSRTRLYGNTNDNMENKNLPKIQNILKFGPPPKNNADAPNFDLPKKEETKTDKPIDKHTYERNLLFSNDGRQYNKLESETPKKQPVIRRQNTVSYVDEKEKIYIKVEDCVRSIKEAFNMTLDTNSTIKVTDFLKHATLNLIKEDVRNNYSAGRYFVDLGKNLKVDKTQHLDQFCDKLTLNDHPIIVAAPVILQYVFSTLNWLTIWIPIQKRDNLIPEIRLDCKEKLRKAGFKKDTDKSQNIKKIFLYNKLSQATKTNYYFPTKYLNHMSETMEAPDCFHPQVYCEKMCKEGIAKRDMNHPFDATGRKTLFGERDINKLYPGIAAEIGRLEDFVPGEGDPDLARAISRMHDETTPSTVNEKKDPKSYTRDLELARAILKLPKTNPSTANEKKEPESFNKDDLDENDLS